MNATPTPRAARLPDPPQLQGLRVLVLGLGESGLAMVRHLLASEAVVHVADTRETPPALAQLVERYPGVGTVLGGFAPELLDEADALCISPGVSIERGEGRVLQEAALARGIPVWGELDLFLGALRSHDGEAARVLAVTGTNGKTTVTALTTLLLQAAGIDARAAGNIGPAMLDAWHDALAEGALPAVWVLELSSFQLAIAAPPAADAATILNLDEDHLDWHATADSYRAAKARIVGGGGLLVWRRDHPRTHAEGAGAEVSFGPDVPTRPGDLGLVREAGIDWLVRAVADDDGLPRRRGAPPPDVRVNRLMPADALRLRGTHNQMNALAALALAGSVGARMADMLHALRDYRGEPHRCQTIASLNGVDFIDDSKGTNVGATVAALQGLDRRCWLIAGGLGKGQDFTPLRDAVSARAAGVFLIGEAAGELASTLAGTGSAIERCADLRAAVRGAAAAAGSGEAVLLSPACASFDMFENYAARGDAFAECVRELAVERGIVTELPC